MARPPALARAIRTALLSGAAEPLSPALDCADDRISGTLLPASISSGETAELTLTVSASASGRTTCTVRASGTTATREAALDVSVRGKTDPPIVGPPDPPPPAARNGGGCSSASSAGGVLAALPLLVLALRRARRRPAA